MDIYESFLDNLEYELFYEIATLDEMNQHAMYGYSNKFNTGLKNVSNANHLASDNLEKLELSKKQLGKQEKSYKKLKNKQLRETIIHPIKSAKNRGRMKDERDQSMNHVYDSRNIVQARQRDLESNMAKADALLKGEKTNNARYINGRNVANGQEPKNSKTSKRDLRYYRKQASHGYVIDNN